MMAQSIPELTNYDYNELYYNSADNLITGDFMYQICDLLNKCGIDVQVTNTYNDTIEKAVLEFQKNTKMTETGILTTNVLQAMIVYAKKMDDIIEGADEESEDSENEESTSPHFNSFFDEDNFKMHRRNHKDIKIVFGNKSITKTIKDVIMRSVSVEVDTSGNPISEVYEFIARDVKESDEINDVNKYTGDEVTISDLIPYDFSSVIIPNGTDIDSSSKHESNMVEKIVEEFIESVIENYENADFSSENMNAIEEAIIKSQGMLVKFLKYKMEKYRKE